MESDDDDDVMSMATITVSDLCLYHVVDRDIFRQLVFNLKRKVCESLLVIALWFWLEDSLNSSITSKMVGLSDTALLTLANEATLCLTCLESKMPIPPGVENLLIAKVIGRDISMHTMFENKYRMISGIKTFLRKVCAWIFTDILVQVLPTSSRRSPNIPLAIPGFPHATFGSIQVLVRPPDFPLPVDGLRDWKLTQESPEDDRTMFLTFSRGFPVSDTEVRNLFNKRFGTCVESLQMEEVLDDSQPLYARLVLSSVSYMDRILVGKQKAMLQINGKHVWARKYERQEPISSKEVKLGKKKSR